MTKVQALARNTFLEARRDRVQWILVVYVAVVIGGAAVLSPLSIGEGYRVTRDLGLAALSLIGCLLIAMVGGTMIQKEVERRTVVTLLSKPVRRGEFLAGKFLGLLGMVTLVFAGMMLVLVATLFVREGRVEPAVLVAGLFTYGELMILTALVVTFSAFLVSPVLSGLFTLAVFVLGHLAEDLLWFAEQSGNKGLEITAQVAYHVLPQMHLYNLRAEAAYGILPEMTRVWAASGYAVAYSAAVLVLGAAILGRREFR